MHEAGHFAIAKWAGMKVEEFGFGFPPRLFALRRGETEYSVNLIPLGGFVKIFGETGEFREEPRSFAAKSKGKRAAVLVAGVAMNLVLAFVLLSAGFMWGIPTSVDDALPGHPNIRNTSVQITYVLPDSPAMRALIEMGDEVLAVNGVSVTDAARARELIGAVPVGTDFTILVKRDGATREFTLAPELLQDSRAMIGAQLSTIGLVSYAPFEAVVQGMGATATLTSATVDGFVSLIGRLIRGEGVGADLAGPVGIAVMTGDVARLGFSYLLYFTALLSVNLAVLNIIPFPALDGGRLLFLGIEAVRRKQLSPMYERAAHGLGFALLILLVILVTYKDIMRLLA